MFYNQPMREDIENILKDEHATDALFEILNSTGSYTNGYIETIADVEGKVYVQEIRTRFNPLFSGFNSNSPDDWQSVALKPYINVANNEAVFQLRILKRSGELLFLETTFERLATLMAFLAEEMKTMSVRVSPKGKGIEDLEKDLKEIREGVDYSIIKFTEFKDTRFRILYVYYYKDYVQGEDDRVLNDLKFVDRTILRTEERFLVRGHYISVENGKKTISNKGITEVTAIIQGFANYLRNQDDDACKADAKQIELTGGVRSKEFYRIKNVWRELFKRFLSGYQGLE